MQYYKQILTGISLFVFMLFSCEPRIEFDEGQWGDNAVITDILLFTLEEQEHQLEEYYQNGETTTGIRRQFINVATNIDELAATVIVNVSSGTDLTKVGLVIRHMAKTIEPLNGAPKAGFLNDFSNGPYTYRVISADGTERDWTISFNID
jgi:hypothetical protein